MVPILIWEKMIHYETKTTPYRMNKVGNLAQCGKDQLETWLFYKLAKRLTLKTLKKKYFPQRDTYPMNSAIHP